MISLGYAADTPTAFSRATGVSHDGNRIVGQATIEREPDVFQSHAILWEPGVQTKILDVRADATESWAYDISGDGSTIVGWMTLDGKSMPTKWDAQTGAYTELPLSEGFTSGFANAVSFDGSVIVGELTAPENVLRAAYWVNEGEPSLIPPLFDYVRNNAISVTDDGMWIGGQSLNQNSSAAEGYLYHREFGEYNLSAYMLAFHGRLVDTQFTPRILRFSRAATWIVGDAPDPIIRGSRVPFRVKVPTATVDDYFGETEPIADTALRQTWFGFIEDTAFPFIFHAEHGWLSLNAWGESGGFAFDLQLGWLYIQRDNYPYLQIMGSGNAAEPKWYYYELGSMAPRRFYDVAEGEWVDADVIAGRSN